MTTLDPEGLEKAAEVLRNEGLTEDGGSPHSWRCEYPDRYPGYCTCAADLARTAVSAYLGHTEVTTVEELDALPNGSVILDHLGDAWQKIADHWESVGEDIMSGDAFFRFHNLKALPARIIHRPTP